VRWFVIDASAMTDIDYSASHSLRELCEDLKRRKINLIFGRVNVYLRADMDRHRITSVISEAFIFSTLHEALSKVRIDMRG
jgi:MFS superfamily sulfate permease-like transporter